jgi:hypothetical protein
MMIQWDKNLCEQLDEIYESKLWNYIFGGDGNWGKESIKILEKLKDRTKETVLSALSLPLAEIDNKLPVDRKSKAKSNTNVQIFYLEKLRLGSELFNKIENIHRCIFSIKELDKDIASWKRSTIGIIMFNAKDCFDNALNIINAQDEKLYTNLSVFICEKKITIQNVTEAKNKIKGDALKANSKVNHREIKNILEKIWINILDNFGKDEKTNEELIQEAL